MPTGKIMEESPKSDEQDDAQNLHTCTLTNGVGCLLCGVLTCINIF